MNRRILVSALVVLSLGGGLATAASASTPSTTRHKLCVLGPTPQAPSQEGICITYESPVN